MKGHYLTLILLLFCACSSPNSRDGKDTQSPSKTTWKAPPAGFVVAADSMEYGDDPLNHFYFSVVLRVSKDNEKANKYGMTYDVITGYGPAKAVGQITMPKGGEDLQPLLKRDSSEDYAYVIGFIPGTSHGSDSVFKPYYQVSAKHGEIAIKQLKGYIFE